MAGILDGRLCLAATRDKTMQCGRSDCPLFCATVVCSSTPYPVLQAYRQPTTRVSSCDKVSVMCRGDSAFCVHRVICGFLRRPTIQLPTCIYWFWLVDRLQCDIPFELWSLAAVIVWCDGFFPPLPVRFDGIIKFGGT